MYMYCEFTGWPVCRSVIPQAISKSAWRPTGKTASLHGREPLQRGADRYLLGSQTAHFTMVTVLIISPVITYPLACVQLRDGDRSVAENNSQLTSPTVHSDGIPATRREHGTVETLNFSPILS